MLQTTPADRPGTDAHTASTRMARRLLHCRPPMMVSTGNAGQRLTTSDALSYLREVKNRFADRKEVYDT